MYLSVKCTHHITNNWLIINKKKDNDTQLTGQGNMVCIEALNMSVWIVHFSLQTMNGMT